MFWTVELPNDAFHVYDNGRQARVRASHLPVVDQFQFLGPTLVPASVSFEVLWEAIGPVGSLGSGKTVPPNDPAAFRAEFSRALAHGTFSGVELGFSFLSDPNVTSERGYAELGHERNGSFLLRTA
ncbi:MAG: hypothetical protein JOZ81_33040 [Chloroflexi bacterium]|nr:hypothetical protein [Chloroflexota bacterium]